MWRRVMFLPHQSGLPHLPGVPHLYVNRPLPSWNGLIHFTHALYYACVRSKAMHSIIVTLHYGMLRRFEIHSALKLSRTAILYCRLTASSLGETARWQYIFRYRVSFFFALYMQYSPPFHMCRRAFQCLTALYWFKLQRKKIHNKSIIWV